MAMEPCLRLSENPVPRNACCARLEEFRRDLALCARLERLADLLPELPDALWMQQTLDTLHDAAARWVDGSVTIPGLDGRDASRRLFDSAQAEDVADELARYWLAPEAARVGQLSYMLRALFEGRMRAMTIERLCLGCAQCTYSATS